MPLDYVDAHRQPWNAARFFLVACGAGVAAFTRRWAASPATGCCQAGTLPVVREWARRRLGR